MNLTTPEHKAIDSLARIVVSVLLKTVKPIFSHKNHTHEKQNSTRNRGSKRMVSLRSRNINSDYDHQSNYLTETEMWVMQHNRIF